MELPLEILREVKTKYEEAANIAERKATISDILYRAIVDEEIDPILDKLNVIFKKDDVLNHIDIDMLIDICLLHCIDYDTNELELSNITEAINKMYVPTKR